MLLTTSLSLLLLLLFSLSTGKHFHSLVGRHDHGGPLILRSLPPPPPWLLSLWLWWPPPPSTCPLLLSAGISSVVSPAGLGVVKKLVQGHKGLDAALTWPVEAWLRWWVLLLRKGGFAGAREWKLGFQRQARHGSIRGRDKVTKLYVGMLYGCAPLWLANSTSEPARRSVQVPLTGNQRQCFGRSFSALFDPHIVVVFVFARNEQILFFRMQLLLLSRKYLLSFIIMMSNVLQDEEGKTVGGITYLARGILIS